MYVSFVRPTFTDAGFWVALHCLNGSPLLVRVGTLAEVITPDTSRNTEWRAITRQPGHDARTLETRLYGPFTTQAEADATAAVIKMIDRPYCNEVADAATDRPANTARQVVCRQTGRIFVSAHGAAKYYELDASALNKHLKRKSGFRSVKGREFVYFDELPTDQQETVQRMHEALSKT